MVKAADRIRVGQLLKSELPEQEWEVVAGGDRRQDSVRNGLSACAGVDSIAVHDAARPFATIALLQRVWEESRSTGAAIPAVPVADTIKRVSDGLILETVDRASLWAAQTPQVFAAPILRRAYDEVARFGRNRDRRCSLGTTIRSARSRCAWGFGQLQNNHAPGPTTRQVVDGNLT